MAHELEVWLFADRVGTLALVNGRLSFCYAPSWLSRPNVQVQHWNLFVENADLSKAQTRKRILELARLLPPTARKLQSDKKCGFVGNAIVDRIIALLEQRCALTIRRLTEIASED